MLQRSEMICVLSGLLGLVLLAQVGCSGEQRRRGTGGAGRGEGWDGGGEDGGGWDGGEQADTGQLADAGGCRLAALPEGPSVGSLVREQVAFENGDGEQIALRDLCGQVVWVQVGSEDT